MPRQRTPNDKSNRGLSKKTFEPIQPAAIGGAKGDEAAIGRTETISTILLALATIATAWCSYQAARWSGEQAKHYSEANAARVESAQLATKSFQRSAVQVGLFTQYAEAISNGNRKYSNFLYHRFPPELRIATDAWLATNPLKNPDAPPSPFTMPEYRLSESDESNRLQLLASEKFDQAGSDNQTSDHYVLLTVIFASVLFFAGISTKLNSLRVRYSILLGASTVLIASIAVLVSSPVH